MAETDKEFVERMAAVLKTGTRGSFEDFNRLFALARRGAAVQFALDRIGDWERDYLTDDMPDGAVRDWLGHVSPALERLKPAGER